MLLGLAPFARCWSRPIAGTNLYLANLGAAPPTPRPPPRTLKWPPPAVFDAASNLVAAIPTSPMATPSFLRRRR
jgi:hypothetical protein